MCNKRSYNTIELNEKEKEACSSLSTRKEKLLELKLE